MLHIFISIYLRVSHLTCVCFIDPIFIWDYVAYFNSFVNFPIIISIRAKKSAKYCKRKVVKGTMLGPRCVLTIYDVGYFPVEYRDQIVVSTFVNCK